MNRLLNIALATILSPAFIYGSCNKEKQSDKTDCTHVMCTMMFAMVTADITDASGNAVTADKVFTIKDGSHDTLHFEQQMLNGKYVVIDDSYVKNLQNKQAGFHFIAIKGNKEIVNEPYTISADCCHIKKEAGKDVITTGL